MSDLFKKLNTLVKASVHDFLRRPDIGRRLSLDRAGSGKDHAAEIKTMRQRINEALDYEDELQQRAQVLQNEVDRLDTEADEAVTEGDHAQARHLIDQLQRCQHRLSMAESDLREHRTVTQELIRHVNTLEAAVADMEQEDQAEAGQIDEEALPLSTEKISNVLHEAREKIAAITETLIAGASPAAVPEEDDRPDDEAVDDDLAHRRQRLSK